MPAAAWAQTAANAESPEEAPACQAVTPADQRLRLGSVQVWWHTVPQERRVGQPFSVVLKLCPAEARLLRVDATMPEHRHGMNYKPSLHTLEPGLWRADGLVWHMPGRWELLIEVELGGDRLRLTQSVQAR